MRANFHQFMHGETSFDTVSPEYKIYTHIMGRCCNPKDKAYKNYGERGITICSEWENNPSAFIAWIVKNLGRRPSSKHTLGRIDNNGNYEPGNLRWETWIQQNRNSRNNRLTLADAREIRMLYDRGYSQRELAKEFGTSRSNIHRVINKKIWKENA